MIELMAVDPGGTTGIFTISGNGLHSWVAFPDRHEAEFWMSRELARTGKDRRHIVVCESWIGRGGPMTAQYDAQHIIGWLDGHVALYKQARLFMQSPGDRMWTTPAKMKAISGSPTLHVKNEHALQAARHAIRWIIFHPEIVGAEFAGIQKALRSFLSADSE